MNLKERWYGFKMRKPDGGYSYVWWETIISFYLIIAGVVFMVVTLVFLEGLLFLIFGSIALFHALLSFYWDMREIDGRSKYWKGE